MGYTYTCSYFEAGDQRANPNQIRRIFNIAATIFIVVCICRRCNNESNDWGVFPQATTTPPYATYPRYPLLKRFVRVSGCKTADCGWRIVDCGTAGYGSISAKGSGVE